jgi:hypothetical protein
MRKKPRERIKRRALVGFEVERHSEYFVLLGAIRNIHELFQPFLLGKAHGYCVICFRSHVFTFKETVSCICGDKIRLQAVYGLDQGKTPSSEPKSPPH